MGICPLTNRMCIKLGRHQEGLVCYEGAEVIRIKDLRVCPMTWCIETPKPPEHSKMPA